MGPLEQEISKFIPEFLRKFKLSLATDEKPKVTNYWYLAPFPYADRLFGPLLSPTKGETLIPTSRFMHQTGIKCRLEKRF